MNFKLILSTIIAISWAAEIDANTANNSSFKMSAERKLELLEFRTRAEADTILDEDWSDMERMCPYKFILGVPGSYRSVVLYIPLGLWDSSDIVKLSDEDQDRYMRYTLAKILEDASRQAGFSFDSNQHQEDPPKFDIVVDLEGLKRMYDGMTKLKEQRDLVIEKGIKVLANMGKAYTFMYMEAMDTVWFVNLPLDGPSLGCFWTLEGSFRCKKECHENNIEHCEIYEV